MDHSKFGIISHFLISLLMKLVKVAVKLNPAGPMRKSCPLWRWGVCLPSIRITQLSVVSAQQCCSEPQLGSFRNSYVWFLAFNTWSGLLLQLNSTSITFQQAPLSSPERWEKLTGRFVRNWIQVQLCKNRYLWRSRAPTGNLIKTPQHLLSSSS